PKTGKIVHDYSAHSLSDAVGVSTLAKFEHHFAPIVDFGLFMFGLANAGVSFAGVNNLTWIIFISLVVGKTVGVSLFTYVATLLTFKLPDGMTARDVITAGVISGMGLTVALFVADVAFTDLALKGSAKMGALFTAVVAIFGIIVGKALKVEKVKGDE
ncbi:MAG: Na+/H+ antiporter NhaA, partial [Clostridiales bacterium]|nr:Na+/H+ antiporter NhaA [Clostridiales bacterium]